MNFFFFYCFLISLNTHRLNSQNNIGVQFFGIAIHTKVAPLNALLMPFKLDPKANSAAGGGFTDTASCCGAYTFAQNYRDLFNPQIINGINNNIFNHSIYLYPIPASDFLKITSTNGIIDYKWITIADLNGKILKSSYIQIDQPIEIRDLTNGIYILTTGHNRSFKFLINK